MGSAGLDIGGIGGDVGSESISDDFGGGTGLDVPLAPTKETYSPRPIVQVYHGGVACCYATTSVAETSNAVPNLPTLNPVVVTRTSMMSPGFTATAPDDADFTLSPTTSSAAV